MKSQAWKIAGIVVILCGTTAMAKKAEKANAPPEGKGSKPGPEEVMKRFDADGDGQLNEAELQAMYDARRNRPDGYQRHRPSREEIMGRFDTDGDGELSESEREAMRAEGKRMREENKKRFDADGDGQLSEEERKTMHETLREERSARASEEAGNT